MRDGLEEATGPAAADQVGLTIDPHRNLGDSIGFSKYLLWLETRDAEQREGTTPMVDWNLDADRGYGYHCWDWNRFPEDADRKFPDPEGDVRYKGGHLAISVKSVEEYDEIYPKLERYGCYLEGDALAGRRAPGHKSVYFYDPSGNRLQLIILPPGGDGRARA